MRVDLSKIQKRGLTVVLNNPYRFLIILIFTGLFSLSCARTVTDRSSPLFLEIKIQTRESINTNTMNYLFVFSKTSTPEMVLPEVSPGSNLYFPTPGRTFDTSDPTFSEVFDSEGITPFYQTYFSTWSDYIVIHNNQLWLYSSNTTQFDPTTTDNNTYTYSRNRFDATYSIIGNTLTLTLDASTIYPQLTGNAYFTIATTKVTDGTETGYFRDKIDIQASIPLELHQKNGPNNEIENSGLDGASDIIEWEARLF